MKHSRYPLLEAIGKQWIVGLELWAIAIFGVAVVANFALAFVRPELLGLGVLVGGGIAFSVAFAGNELFYRSVRCPSCTKRLNCFKNGKRVPIKQAFSQLRCGGRCRHCGWQPSGDSPPEIPLKRTNQQRRD